MPNNDKLVDYIKVKVEEVVKRNSNLSSENRHLLKETSRLQKENLELKQRLETFEKREEVDLFASQLVLSEGREAAISKVKKILREIDSCITLINKDI